jgi:hypothetical protein
VSLARFLQERASAPAEEAARTPHRPAPSGLRDDAAIERYARRAARFLRSHPDAAVGDFARFLCALASVELDKLGVPAPKPVDCVTRGVVGDLTDDEAAMAAMTVWRSARHAEQRCRIARMLAGEPMPAGELAEAREWWTGEDASYRQAVTAWQADVEAGARLARGVTAPEEVRVLIGRMLATWSKPGGAIDVVRLHRSNVADVQAMTARFEAVETEWRAVGRSPARRDFVDLAEALRELARAIDTAYRNQPVEKDAHEVGHKTFDAFHAELARRSRPRARRNEM